MRKVRAFLLPLVICVYLTANAQSTLQPGTPIERSLGLSQVQEFTVNLQENTLIQVVVEQRGIDVIVRVFSPAGKSLGEFDSPNGDDGPEHVSFVAIAAGAYRIAVSPLDPQSTVTGRFEIKILEMRDATDQELKASKNLDVIKEKGIALLLELDGLITQIKSPLTRIKAQLQAAQLLWSTDEKRASKYFTDATNGFKEYFGSMDAGSENFQQQYNAVMQLRFEIIRVLAERDPDAALNFVYATVPPPNPYNNRDESAVQETQLELSIANQIMRNDPNRAFEIARRSLKKNFSPNLMSTVATLRRQNPELASQLANEIAGKLLTAKLLGTPGAANLAIGLLRFGQSPIRRVQITDLSGVTPPPQARVSILPDNQYRELLQKALKEALSYSPPANRNYTPERDAAWSLLAGLQQMGPDLDTIMNGGAAAVEKKLAELNNQNPVDTQQIQNTIGTNPVDAALEAIQKAPAEQREQLYLQLAGREANSGNIARARQIINERVSNPYQRRSSLMNLEQQEIYRAVSKGKVEEALRIISGFRTPKERASLLSQIVNQIGPGQKRANAINFLEQARGLLDPSLQAQDQEQMNVLLEIARAFAKYDTKRSFEILDPLVEQFNDICAAARTMEGFGQEYYEDDELNMENGSSLTQIAQRMSTLLGTLALTNFERARTTSERIRLPEVRLRIYLDIAQQTINPSSVSSVAY